MRFWIFLAEGAFPEGAVFFLVVLTVLGNLLIKLVRRSWALRQAELLLVWCMLIVAATVPSEGLMSYWFPTLTAPTYLSRRADITWRETSLANAPEGLMLSKDPRSPAVRQFFEGRPEGGRFPWGPWISTISRWLLFMACLYGATFFLCGMLRKQWVEVERLQFALARVPLEFTEEGKGLLPRIFSNRAFLTGLACALALRFIHALPLFFGAETRLAIIVPFADAFRDTPLQVAGVRNMNLSDWLIPIGFAYLVPADVSLSVWGFYVLGRLQLLTAHTMGSPLATGGMLQFEQAAAYLTFAAGSLFLARRHLWTVLRKALGPGRNIDDSGEPVGYRLAVWGFLICSVGGIAWFAHYGMRVGVAIAYFTFLLVIMLAHARVVAQSGMYVPRTDFHAPNVMRHLGFGAFTVFGPTGAILAQMQWTGMMGNTVSLLGPPAIHAYRISDVFDRHRKLLLPALFVSLFVGIATASYITLQQAYSKGALNFVYTWAATGMPQWRFQEVHQWMERPSQLTDGAWKSLAIGAGLTGFVMFMRARFYWWPVHAIGLLTVCSDHIDRIWLQFLLGWLIKGCMVRFSTGRAVRAGRFFFIGFILTEGFLLGVSSITRTLSGGVVPMF
jgi:hypothetical protein